MEPRTYLGGFCTLKQDPHRRIYNVEDVFGSDFSSNAPVERLIKKYFLHATSKNKIFTVDLTPLHEYKTNFGFSVLLNRLNPWLAELASESAEKHGGGIITGVHVSNIQWIDNKTIVKTDELEEFEVKSIIAADGINSEVAEVTSARGKFRPEEVYFGVKVIIKLPEKIIEEQISSKFLRRVRTSFCRGHYFESYWRRFSLYKPRNIVTWCSLSL